ncbi:MAG: mechanosensitive ion channel family protein [Clostridia bacterium]
MEEKSVNAKKSDGKFKTYWNKKTGKQKALFILQCILCVGLLAFFVLGVFSKQIFGEDALFTKTVGTILNLFDGVEIKLPTIINTATYIVVILAISYVIRLILKGIMSKINKGKSVVNLIDSAVKYISAIILIIAVLNLWGVDTATLLASVGILGLVIGLGCQSLIEDIVAGLFIIFEKTFEVGDIVTIDGFRGTITEIGIRNTKILDAGGDTKVISNSDIRTVVNMTNDLSIALCDVAIEYGESIERVENIINANLTQIKDRIPAICDGPYYKGVNSLADSGVIIRLVAKCKEEDKFQTIRDLNREIKIIFDKNGVNIPFPQVVINQPTDFKAVTKKQRAIANAFVDKQKELSKDINEEER